MVKRRKGLENEILAFLKKDIPGRRLNHILGVVDLAERLAAKHGADPEKARMAGLLHDAARSWTFDRLIRYARRHRISMPDRDFIFACQPVLIHSYVGAHLARSRFGIRDPGILSAIRNHSLGSAHMSKLDRVLYVADLLAPDRVFDHADRLRKLAMKDLDAVYREGVAVKMIYLLKSGQPVHPAASAVWNHALA